MPTNTYVALDKITVSGSSTNTVTLSAIPQTYKDLVIVCAGTQASLTDMAIRFNSDTAGNYSKTLLYGNGSATGTANYTTANQIFVTYQSTTEANVIMHIMNYTSTSVQKTVLAKGSANGTGIQMNAGAWRKSPLEAINSITLFPASGANFSNGYTVSLYGIAAEAGGSTPKAIGGTVTSDATYWYHEFTTSGNFVPNQSLTCDFLVIAGGGGGAQNGGGGAGGYRSSVTATGGGGTLLSPLSLTAQSYQVLVGAGGAVATSGSSSSFATISTTGGGRAGGLDQNGTSGGSGGGSGGNTQVGGTFSGGAGTANEGFAGGSTPGATNSPAGGGGGAGGVGGNGNGSVEPRVGGSGGIGLVSSISGTSVGRGGGGASGSGGLGGTATQGGGAGASGQNGINATAGTANTGGGGGGAGGARLAAAGGSGVVIVRYLKA